MQWQDEAYLLSKNSYSENSVIVDVLTKNHGRYNGIVYGGSSSKLKRYLQIGNKILINYKTKNQKRIGYFSIEIIKSIAPLYFDDRKRTIAILSASSILKLLLPEQQPNIKTFTLFENFINNLNDEKWIYLYIFWEQNLIKELGYDIDLSNKKIIKENTNDKYEVYISGKMFMVPKFIFTNKIKNLTQVEIRDALIFNKYLFNEYIIDLNKNKLPRSRNILENYFI